MSVEQFLPRYFLFKLRMVAAWTKRTAPWARGSPSRSVAISRISRIAPCWALKDFLTWLVSTEMENLLKGPGREDEWDAAGTGR